MGRLQTDADRERVVDSLENATEVGGSAAEIENVIRRLGQRWFLVRNVHATPNTALLQPRWALSFLRGPMTLGDIRRVLPKGRAERLLIPLAAWGGWIARGRK